MKEVLMKRLLLFLPAAAIILCIVAYAAPASAQYQYSPYTYPYNEYPLGRDPYPYNPYFQPFTGYGYPYDSYYPYDEYEEYPEFYYPGFYGGYWNQPHEERFGAHERFSTTGRRGTRVLSTGARTRRTRWAGRPAGTLKGLSFVGFYGVKILSRS